MVVGLRRSGAGAGGADSGGDHEEDAGGCGRARDLPEDEQAGQQRDGGLQAHQRAEGAGREPAQGEKFQAERQHGMQRGQRQHYGEQRPGQRVESGGKGGRQRHDAGDRDGDGQPAEAGDPVADVLGQQDVDAPAGRGSQREDKAGGVNATVPRPGQQHHAGRGQDRPAPAPAAGPEHRHRQRPEELQRAGGAERDVRDREHEQRHQAGGYDAKRGAGQQVLAGEVAGRGRTRISSRRPAQASRSPAMPSGPS